MHEIKDYLWLNLKQLPYFRAFLRAFEGRFYEEVKLEEPILDVGCGDGVFAAITFDKQISIGFDPGFHILQEPANQEAYNSLYCGAGANIPFEDGYFKTIISNSVLEHIPDLETVMQEIYRVLSDDGTFIFCVPNDALLENLSIAKGMERIGLRKLAESYRAFFNRISRHHHADNFTVWEGRLKRAGFKIERWWHYFNPAHVRILEWGHYFGLPSLVNKKLFGRWILMPYHWNLFIPERQLRKHYQQDARHPKGSYSFYIVRKG